MASYAAGIVEEEFRPALLKLSDMNASATSIEDIRGWRVIDSNGETLGHVRELFIDSHGSKIRFLLVAPHGVLSLFHADLPIPVDAVIGTDDRTVLIDCTCEQVIGSPRCYPDVMDDCYWEEVCAYYGYAPLWGRKQPGFCPDC